MSALSDTRFGDRVRAAYAGGAVERDRLAEHILSGQPLGPGEAALLADYGFAPEGPLLSADTRSMVAHLITVWTPPKRSQGRPIGTSVVSTTTQMLVGLEFVANRPSHGAAGPAKEALANQYGVSLKTVEAWITSARRAVRSIVDHYAGECTDADVVDRLRIMLGGTNP